MSSCSNVLSTEAGYQNHQDGTPDGTNLNKCGGNEMEHEVNDEEDEDGDEEEDLDFYPFLKETPSLEASSSLSSEVEGLDADVVDSAGNTSAALVTNLSTKPPCETHDYAVGDFEHGEEIVMQTAVSSGGACEEELGKILPLLKLRKRKSALISQPENGTICGKENGTSSGADAIPDIVGEYSNTKHSRKPSLDIDDEDAICMRTRARYSLASFTLDELETFLQETDDDDDLQNVDDEEEYRKFLAAVLHGGDGDNETIQENENVYDEDEDNDADFEIEIEEALESDFDENARDENPEKECMGAGRRPETRQNRRQRSSAQNKKKMLEQANRPLRPLLPNAPIVPYPIYDGKNLMPETTSHYLSSSARDGFINGFTPHQLGQLHCLIHEHVQLLIQVFSICILEPSRQHIASKVQELISDMLHKRDQVLSWRRVPYPCFCFCPPYIHPSVPDEPFGPLTVKYTLDAQSECSSGNNELLPSDVVSPSQGGSTYVSTGEECRFQTNDGSFWVPFKNDPILSVLDVAPLSLVGIYMDDISTAVREYQRRHVESTCDTCFQKEPMFPLPSFQSSAETNGEGSRETTSPAANLAPSPPASDRPPKKTLAAALVERTKKQSVALVPREIAKLAQRFFPLFNPALFPHKPPPAPVVNRVLFTDSEDELLAMGLMEYNTDWKAIQQRFLPCKSKHQIFVRQKNRSSSKAPENPIKAVRRMKNSPLTAEEMARIQEGLKIFKLDWMSVWKFTVPYRDPSLLPRQWRVATGTQKSYKSNADKKEKRRLYESHRRKCKPPSLASWQTSSEKEDCHTDNAGGENNSGDDCMDDKDEAYVHEAFLEDWRPGTSCPVSQLQEGSRVWEQNTNCGSRESQLQIGHKFPDALNYSKNLHASYFTHARNHTSTEPIHPVSDMKLRSSKTQFCGRPYRARRANSARLVKLAPDLPPVNLPPSVRVMSQSAFRSYQSGTSTNISAVDAGNGEAATENIAWKLPHVAKSRTIHPMKTTENKNNSLKHGSSALHQQRSAVICDKRVAVEKDNSDLQMHPLLFPTPDNGPVPYYQLNCGSSAYGSFNFFSGNLPQLNLSLFRKSHQANSAVNFLHKSSKSTETTSSSCGIDFHPLLQRSDNVNSDSVTTHSAAQPYVNLESFRGKCSMLQSSSDAVLTKSQVSSDPTDTCNKTSAPCGKGNELDLDIHLSFTSRKEKAIRNRDVIEHNQTRSKLNVPDSGVVEEIPDKLAVLPDGVNSKLDSDFHGLVMSGSCISRYDANNVGEQSLPEIVMEQEELSDSEDEVGEHVEFECEEMADSEGEESESEQIVDVQNKLPSVTAEKMTTNAEFDDKQCEIGGHCKSQGPNCSHSEADTLELDLREQGKGNPSSSVLLSSNSHAHNTMDPNTEESRNTEGLAGKHWASARPNRSCKKTVPSPKRVTSQKQGEDLPQQLEFNSLVEPSRKPRKRSCRTNLSRVKRGSNSNTCMVVDSSNSLCND